MIIAPIVWGVIRKMFGAALFVVACLALAGAAVLIVLQAI